MSHGGWHIEQRNGTTALWESTNPILNEGEVGWETDTGRSKLGDGITAWVGLGYTAASGLPGAIGPAGPPGPIGNTIVETISGVYTLDAAAGTEYTLTLNGDVSFAVSNLTNGAVIKVTLIQDGIGAHTVTLPSLPAWTGEAEVNISETANHFTILVIWKEPMGICVKQTMTGPVPEDYWTPAQLADQVVWFNADTIGGEDLDPVTGWLNLYDDQDLVVDAGSPTLHIHSGVKYVRFDGNDAMDSPNLTNPAVVPYTVAMLVRLNALSGVQAVLDGPNAVNDMELFGGDSPMNWRVNGADANDLLCNTDWVSLLVTVALSPNGKFRADGVQSSITSTGGKGLSAVIIGRNQSGTQFLTGDIAEWFVIEHASDPTEIANIETYLNLKRDILNGA